ncbi:MAG: TfoX family protein [Chloroflexi bacterium]|nr:TfoX family protein [Chloroflexota bacterium]
MAHDEGSAQRIREILAEYESVVEQKMFGGLSFMLRGNFACGLTKADLVVRVGPDRFDDALTHPHTRIMDFTGRPMKGWIYVNPAGYESDKDLMYWVQQGVDFALSLPAK